MEDTVAVLSGVLLWSGAIGVVVGAAYKLLARRSREASAASQEPALRKEQSR